MNDMTTGAFVSYVVALTAEAIFTSGVGEVVRRSYDSLKSKLSSEWKNEVELIENRPTSTHRQQVLAELIDECNLESLNEIISCAEDLRILVIGNASEPNIGVKLSNVSARNIRFDKIEVENGSGLIMDGTTTSEDIDVKTIRVGKLEGKTPR